MLKADTSRKERCDRCGELVDYDQLAPVGLVLRFLAFPMILLMLMLHPTRLLRNELVQRYCPQCRPGQVACYVVVAIWSTSLIVAWALGWTK